MTTIVPIDEAFLVQIPELCPSQIRRGIARFVDLVNDGGGWCDLNGWDAANGSHVDASGRAFDADRDDLAIMTLERQAWPYDWQVDWAREAYATFTANCEGQLLAALQDID